MTSAAEDIQVVIVGQPEAEDLQVDEVAIWICW